MSTIFDVSRSVRESMSIATNLEEAARSRARQAAMAHLKLQDTGREEPGERRRQKGARTKNGRYVRDARAPEPPPPLPDIGGWERRRQSVELVHLNIEEPAP